MVHVFLKGAPLPNFDRLCRNWFWDDPLPSLKRNNTWSPDRLLVTFHPGPILAKWMPRGIEQGNWLHLRISGTKEPLVPLYKYVWVSWLRITRQMFGEFGACAPQFFLASNYIGTSKISLSASVSNRISFQVDSFKTFQGCTKRDLTSLFIHRSSTRFSGQNCHCISKPVSTWSKP